MQMVKDVKENLLCLAFSFKKLNVIQNKHIYLQIKIGKLLNIIGLDGFKKLIGKLLGRYIQHKFALQLFLDLVANGLHQMCLSKTYSSIQLDRIEGSDARSLSY